MRVNSEFKEAKYLLAIFSFLVMLPYIYLELRDGRWPGLLKKLTFGRIIFDPIVVFSIALFISLKFFRNRLRFFICSVLTLTYLRLNASDLPLLSALLLNIGYIIIGLAFIPQQLTKYLFSDKRFFFSSIATFSAISLIVGGITYSMAIMLLSTQFYVDELLTYATLVFLATLSSVVRGSSIFCVARLFFKGQFVKEEKAKGFTTDIFVFVIIFNVLAILGAIGNPAGEFDAEWYGTVQSHIMPTGHFFEKLHFQHFVYYYPKGFELITYPIRLSISGAEIQAFNFLVAALALGVIHRLMNVCARKELLVIFSALILSIPVVQSTAISWKPDFFASLVIVIAIISLTKSITLSQRNLDGAFSFWCVSAFLASISLSFKFSVYLVLLPFGLALLYALVVILKRLSQRNELNRFFFKRQNLAILLLGLGVVFSLLISMRTFFTSGVPIVGFGLDKIFDIQQHLANSGIGKFHSHNSPEIYGVYKSLAEVLEVVFNVFYFPSFSVHHHSAALGPISLIVMLFAVALSIGCLKRILLTFDNEISGFDFLSTCVFVCVALFGWALVFFISKKGGDSNYFLTPVILSATFVVFWFYDKSVRLSRVILIFPIVVSTLFCSFNYFYQARLVKPWSMSTTHSDLYFNLRQGYSKYGAWLDEDYFELHEILSKNKTLSSPNCFGYILADKSLRPSRWAYLLPCAIEGGQKWYVNNLLANSDSQPMKRINLLILQKELLDSSEYNRLISMGWVLESTTKKFEIYLKKKTS